MQLQSLPPTPRRREPVRIQRAVLFALVVRDLRTRVQGRWLSLSWMVFEPLAHVMLIVGLIGARSKVVLPSIDLPVFLVTGMLPFFLFRNLARRLPTAISSNKSLFAYRQVKPIDALAARAMVEIALYSTVYVIALCLLGWSGYHSLPHAPLELMAVGAVLLNLGVSLGLLFSVLTHQRPKVNTVVGFAFYPLYLISGVIFPLHNLSSSIRTWLLYNPVLHLVELSRFYFIPNYAPVPGVSLAYPAACTLIVAALAMSLYRVYRFRFTTVG